MASLPPPLPPSSRPPVLPPPLPVGYRPAQINRDARWVTVASLRTASQWHVACAALTRQQIVSRVNPDAPESDAMELQVMTTEAEWAREILGQSLPRKSELPGGFPVAVTPVATSVVPGSSSGPAAPNVIAAMPVGPVRNTGPDGPGYYSVLTILWIVLIFLVLLSALACFGWYFTM